MRNSFIIFFITVFLSCSVSAQLSETQRIKLITQYNEIVTKAETIGNRADSVDFVWYAQLLEPYMHLEFFPDFYKEADPEFFTDENMDARSQWIASSQEKLKKLRLRKDITIYVEKADSLHVYNHEQLTSYPKFKSYRRKTKLKWHLEFLPSVELIKLATADTIKKNTVNYLQKLKLVEKKYQNKYLRGYRDRNLLSFFVDGYLEHRKRKRMKTRFEEKGLLKEPSRGAVILLAPPLIGVSSNSFTTIENNGTMVGLVQILGYDRYIGQSFKNYFGFSIFHASPLNSTMGLWDSSMIGLEVHYKNLFNIGYGLGYKEQTIGTETGRFGQIFVSVALFNKFFKKE
jgi:hypothetical protein